MTELGAYVLGLVLLGFTPGRSPFSLERLPECGTDPKQARCNVAPVCPQTMASCANPETTKPCCAVPKWHKELGWVRTENRDVGTERLKVVAQALADAAEEEAAGWREPGGARDLSRAMISAFGWSTGFREDIQTGRMRGPGGEACLSDMRIKTLRLFVAPELRDLPEPELVDAVTGLDYASQRQCMGAGARAMVQARRVAGWKCTIKGRPKLLSAFAIYGTGNYCMTADVVGAKFKTLNEHRDIIVGLEKRKYDTVLSYRYRGDKPVYPAWYKPSG
jgi:hypothetical protein